jgi:hypothetical protein
LAIKNVGGGVKAGRRIFNCEVEEGIRKQGRNTYFIP